jgi:hypothetical protein
MYNKEAYEKLKEEAPDRLKGYRLKAYYTYKEKNPDKLVELRKAASAKYYKEHKDEIAARRKEKYVSKRKNPLKYLGKSGSDDPLEENKKIEII